MTNLWLITVLPKHNTALAYTSNFQFCSVITKILGMAVVSSWDSTAAVCSKTQQNSSHALSLVIFVIASKSNVALGAVPYIQLTSHNTMVHIHWGCTIHYHYITTHGMMDDMH